ncbi:MAG: hypothetical protein H7Z75_16415 [Ferruginibacter sp.]|nr:hypothetical protein [Cytophagales bacterium]
MKAASLFLGFYLLLGGLLPHAEYAELTKLPGLYAHYQTHLQRTNGQLSFADFLVMHYADRQHAQSEDHQQLPFQHHHSCVATLLYCVPGFDFCFVPVQFAAAIRNRYQPILRFFPPSRIFQPPK